MLEITKRKLFFKIKEIWFADIPTDNFDCSAVIFKQCKNLIPDKTFKCTKFSTLIIDLTQGLDAAWNNMDKSSCRYSINKALKDGVKVRINQDYLDFYAINREFRRHKKLKIGTNGSLDFIKKYGTLFTSELHGEILGGCLFLEDEHNLRWLLGASKRFTIDKKKSSLIGNANRLILWEAIKYAYRKNIKEFDFGGIYTEEREDKELEKINTFKQSFGGQLVTHYTYEKNYSLIYNLIVKFYRKLYG